MPFRWTRLIALLLLLLATPAFAAEEWWIAQSRGTVWILEQGQPPRLASPGTIFPNAATLATGPAARALLMHGAESVLVGPSTVLALVQRGGRTRVVQVSGVAEFEVERQNVQHFSVETRYFAAIVKGTHFTVSVADDGARVAVERGTVEVTAPESGQRTDLTAGMAAVVSTDNPAIGIFGGRPTVFQIAPPRSTPVPLADGSASPVVGAQADPQGDNDEDQEDDDSPTVTPPDASIPDAPGGPPSGEGDGSGSDEDDDRGHGNDDDHDDDDNSGHGNGDDGDS